MAFLNHSELDLGAIHKLPNLTYPDSSDREAGINEGSGINVTADNLDQIAKQLDNNTLWRLTGIGPPLVWQEIITTPTFEALTFDQIYNNQPGFTREVTVDDENVQFTCSGGEDFLVSITSGSRFFAFDPANPVTRIIQLLETDGSLSLQGANTNIGAEVDIDITATIELNFSGRGAAATPFNEVGDTVLSGFTATSIIGALNELKTGGAGFTQGSVIFADNLGKLDEDNANFFWNDANNRLGIGTNSPSGILHILGDEEVIYERAGFGSFEQSINNVISALDLTLTAQNDDSGYVFRSKNNVGTVIDALMIESDGVVRLNTTIDDAHLNVRSTTGPILSLSSASGTYAPIDSSVSFGWTPPYAWIQARFTTNPQDMLFNPEGGNVFIGTEDRDGTPAVGALTVKGTTNDGSTNVQVWRDSDEANVAWVDTNGDIATEGTTITIGQSGTGTLKLGSTHSMFGGSSGFEFKLGGATTKGMFWTSGGFQVGTALADPGAGNVDIQGTCSLGGGINIGGAVVENVTTVSTATYSLLATDRILHVTRTATGTCEITLPTAQIATDGRRITIKDAEFNAATYNITIKTEGSEEIDGSALGFPIGGDGDSQDFYFEDGNVFAC